MIVDILTFIVLGIMTGGVYALLGLSLNLIFGVMRVINVAHGEMLTLGAYTAVLLGAVGIGGVALPVVAAILLVTFAGLVIARVLLRPLTIDGRVHEQRGMVMSLGLSLFLSNAVLAAFGPDYQRVPGVMARGAVEIGDLVLEGQRLVILAGSMVLATALMLFLRFTLVGLAIRAVGENPEAAQANGISVPRIHLITFALGSALAGAAGALITPVTYAFPAMGFTYTLYAFITIIIGGLGSVWGAVLAGFLLGIAESLSVIWLTTGYNAIVGPGLMLLMLLLRPQGLLGRRLARA
jgi:branched-chain amino acid transport system permease protein